MMIEKYLVRGKEFDNKNDAEFYDIGQRVQEALKNSETFRTASPADVAQWAVCQVFDRRIS